MSTVCMHVYDFTGCQRLVAVRSVLGVRVICSMRGIEVFFALHTADY